MILMMRLLRVFACLQCWSLSGVLVSARRTSSINEQLELELQAAQGAGQQKLGETTLVGPDRLECLRQDNLDLVFPSKETYAFRKVFGVNGDDTNRDVYLVADSIKVKKLQAWITVRRIDETDFAFAVGGDETYGEHEGVASLEFHVVGLDLRTPSTAIDLLASMVTDRAELLAGKEGSLKFKIFGRGSAVFDEDTSQWEIELTDTRAEPFQFLIENHWLVQKAITDYGGIDKIVIDQLWPMIKQVVPKTMASSFHKLPTEDLGIEATVKLTGKENWESDLLEITALQTLHFWVNPSKAAKVFDDLTALDRAFIGKVQDLLDWEGLPKVWKENRAAVIRTLQTYNLLFDPALVKKVKNTDDIADVRDDLLEAAKGSMDWMKTAVKPMLDLVASHKNVFHELDIGNDIVTSWSREDGGKIKGNLFSPSPEGTRTLRLGSRRRATLAEKHELALLPNAMLQAFKELKKFDIAKVEAMLDGELRAQRLIDHGKAMRLLQNWGLLGDKELLQKAKATVDLYDLREDFLAEARALNGAQAGFAFVRPEADDLTTFELSDVTFRDAKFTIDSMVIKNTELEMGNRSTGLDLWRLVGQASDVSVQLPAWDSFSGVDMALPHLSIRLHHSGDVSLSLGDSYEEGFGLEYDMDAKKKTAKQKGVIRSGPTSAIDGEVPEQFSRPVQTPKGLRLAEVAPQFGLTLSSSITGQDDIVEAEISSEVTTQVDLSKIFPIILAGRQSSDYGYIFYTGRVKRYITSPDTTPVVPPYVVDVVVSCGFLRLLDRSHVPYGKELDRIGMDPESGLKQLEVDLTQYDEVPEVYSDGQDGSCMDLLNNGQERRLHGAGFWSAGEFVQETICGPTAEVKKLSEAMELQVNRFHDERAREWKYSTHNIVKEQDQYTLPDNMVSQGLSRILRPPVAKARSDKEPSSNALLQTEGDKKAGAESANATEKAISRDRMMCKNSEALDQEFFKIEDTGLQQALRIATPTIPHVGRVFLVLDDVEVIRLKAEVDIRRMGDRSFSFHLRPPTNQEEVLLAFFSGLEFKLPDSSLGGLAKFAAGVENGFGRLFAGENYGRLDQGPLSVSLDLKGEVEMDDNGKWTLKTANPAPVSKAHIKVGPQGAESLLQGYINSAIEKNGGMDKLLLDNCWPFLTKLIPAALGEAMDSVKASEAGFQATFLVSADCKEAQKSGTSMFRSGADLRCPKHELDMTVTSTVQVNREAEGLLRSVARRMKKEAEEPMEQAKQVEVDEFGDALDDDEWHDALEEYPGEYDRVNPIIAQLLKAYERSASVFTGTAANEQFIVEVNDDFSAQVRTFADLKFPMTLLKALTGEGNEAMMQFIPKPEHGSAKFVGTVEFDDSVFSVPEMRVDNIQLPVTLSSDPNDKITVAAMLGPLELHHVKGPMAEKLEQLKQVKLKGSSVTIELDKAQGFVLKVKNGEEEGQDSQVVLDIGSGLVTPHLDTVSTSMLQPGNTRKAQEYLADGRVPAMFERPWPYRPEKLDFQHIVQGLSVEANTRMAGEAADDTAKERLAMSVTATVSGGIVLDSHLLRAGRAKSTDWGYLYYLKGGRYGEINPKKPKALKKDDAVLQITCGYLYIWDASKSWTGAKADQYDELLLSMDLSDQTETKKHLDPSRDAISILMTRGGEFPACIKVKQKDAMWGNKDYYYFCQSEEEIKKIEEAITLQRSRFADVEGAKKRALKQALKRRGSKVDGPTYKAPEPPSKEEPMDGSWFKEMKIDDGTTFYPHLKPPGPNSKVLTPAEAWKAEVAAVQG
eukprot:TRINITY_DN121513_c0_g1_i1.p1 TRINITY_DN121513_c0_g1~~TRINITY_DN121513_c0_g1_i1.p1  ORF type:complete len:1769 (-),score=493.06 TRINITY_DN121513_c0_g1_i1:21-5327(-)